MPWLFQEGLVVQKTLRVGTFEGSSGSVLPEVKLLLVNMMNVGKPVVALCVSPVVVAKALEGSGAQLSMTIGTDKKDSPYSIEDFSKGLQELNVATSMKSINEINIDIENKLITAPCYMMNASLLEVRDNVKKAVEAINTLL